MIVFLNHRDTAQPLYTDDRLSSQVASHAIKNQPINICFSPFPRETGGHGRRLPF
jgi:hypothetical protein